MAAKRKGVPLGRERQLKWKGQAVKGSVAVLQRNFGPALMLMRSSLSVFKKVYFGKITLLQYMQD